MTRNELATPRQKVKMKLRTGAVADAGDYGGYDDRLMAQLQTCR